MLHEFYVQATRTTRSDALDHNIAVGLIATWTRFAVQDVTLAVLEGALDIKAKTGLSYWDSAIVAVSWPSVVARPPGYQRQEGDPGFWEYYEPHTGAPLGAKPMTWTASLFVELQDMGED